MGQSPTRRTASRRRSVIDQAITPRCAPVADDGRDALLMGIPSILIDGSSALTYATGDNVRVGGPRAVSCVSGRSRWPAFVGTVDSPHPCVAEAAQAVFAVTGRDPRILLDHEPMRSLLE